MFVRFAPRTLLLSALVVCASASGISAAPILFYNFNDSGSATASSGAAPGEVATMYAMTSDFKGIAPTELHSAAGTGVAGDIVGSLLYGVDKAFNASGGIAVNQTSTAVSSLTSWTLSGWYKPSTSLIAGSCLFQTPGGNGYQWAGFAVRANSTTDLRVGVATSSGVTQVGTTTASFDPLNEWVFFAVTYNGTLSSNNVNVYEGFRNSAEALAFSSTAAAATTLVATLTVNKGTPGASVGYALGARLNTNNTSSTPNNYTLTGSTPSIIQSQPALYDNFRVDSGVLGQSALEAYRVGDISIAPNTFVWSSTANSSWENGAGWTSGSGTTGAIADGAGQIAIFGAPGTVGAAVLASNHALGALTFMGSVGTTLGGGGTLTFGTTAGPAAISVSGSNTVNAPLVFNAGTSAALASASQLTLGGSISGSGGLTVGGSGQLTLTGSNSYSGPTAVSGGTLVLGSANALQGSTFSAAAGLLAFPPGIVTFNLGGLAGSGNLVLSDTAGNPMVLSVGGNNQDTSFAGVLSGLGDLFKVGTGKLTLNNANTFSGDVTLNAGVISLGNFYALGNGGLTANGGTLDLGGFFRATKSLSGSAGIITNNTAGAPATLVVNQAGNTTFSGAINDGLGAVALYKSGPGTLTLAHANGYSGMTTITGGVLSAGAAATLSPNSPVYISGGTLDVSGQSQTIQSLTMGSGATLNVGNYNILGITGAANCSGVLNITGDTAAAVLLTYGAVYGRFTVPSNEIPSGYRLSYSSSALSIVANGPPIWQASDGSWNDSLSWVGNAIPSGSGQQAVVGSVTASPVTITLDGPQTLGTLVLGSTVTGSTGGYTLAAGSSGSLTMASSGATLAQIVVSGGSHAIAANLTLAGSLEVTPAASSELTISGNIGDAGSDLPLLLTGPGTLVLSGTNSYSGGTCVEAGTLIVTNNAALLAGSSLVVGEGGTFVFDPTASGSPVGAGSSQQTRNSIAVEAVPEPGTASLVLAALGITMFYLCRSRRGKSPGPDFISDY